MQPVCDDFFKAVGPVAETTSSQLNPFVRSYLDAVRTYLLGLHDDGVPARRVNEEHADLVDRLVRKLFRLAEDRYFEHFPRLDFRLSVIAVGGYGRRELSLGSDIDLLFIYRGKINPYVETLTEVITHRLWDAQLTLGDATRTIQDCMRVGREDLPTLTSFLDARFLIGDPGLHAELEHEVRDYLKKHATSFVDGKLKEMRDRHERFGESLYLLQPNLREGVGALRDYHTAMWTARASRWEVRRPEHLLLHGFLDGEELDELLVALDFLWRARNELHRSGRKNDRLHFVLQEHLAERLGYQGGDGAFPIEELMRSYYIHARAVARLSRRVIDDARNSERLRHPSVQRGSYALAEGFALVDGRLEIPSASLLEERPVRLLSAFALAQHHDVELSARAQRLVRQHLHLVDDAFRKDPEAATLFRQLLQSPNRVYRTLAVMDELDLLGAYLPEFGRLVGLWQQDMYHTYTVDVHSLFLVEQLRRLRKGNFREELPFPTALVREIQAPEVIYLGCILHDIGKGLGGGHSERGAGMVPDIAQRLGFSEDEQDRVEFIVREHLTMSQMAERRDVHDSRVILNLANLCGSRERLRSLYLATIADIRSVSPEAWTTWKGGLLEALYRNAAEWLEVGGEAPDATRAYLERAMTRADEARREATDRLVEDGASRPKVENFLDVVPPRLFLDHSPSQLLVQLRSALAFVACDDLVGVYPFHPDHDEQEFWGICVIAQDRPGLFSQVTGVLTACGHNILAAHVYTTRSGLAIEIYQVDPIAGGAAEEELEVDRIETRLRGLLSGVRDAGTHTARPSARRPRSLRAAPPTVRIANQDSDFYTIIDVSTNDRPALLFDITRALSDFGLEIVMSRAATRANRVTDTFYITDGGDKVADPGRQQEIEASVLRAIQDDRV